MEVETQVPSVGTEVETAAPPTATMDAEAQPQPAEAQPETEELAPVDDDAEVNLEETPDSSGEFEKYKPLFKDNPELRQIVGREQFVSSFAPNGSLRELREIVERVPTLEDAETLANLAENHRTLGETFRNDPAGFTDSLRENDPLAFAQWAEKLPEMLASTDANLYTRQAQYYTNAVLDNLLASAQRTGNQDAITSIQNVAYLLGANLGAPRQQAVGNSEVENLKAQLAQRDKAETESRAVSFWDGANQEYQSTAISEIENVIRRAKPDVTDGQLNRMTSEVWNGLNERLGAQPETRAQVERFKQAVSRGKMGAADHKAIVDFCMKRARYLIPHVSKEVIDQWSSEILAANKKKIADKQAIAARTKEPSAVASPGPAPQAPITAPKRRDPETIFQQLRSGTYQKPKFA